ncbi:MAG: M48 family metalloprotease [Gaiellales bacterium]
MSAARRPPRRLTLRRSALALAALAWLGIAWRLSATTVPGGLELPHVDATQTFGRSVVDAARNYERVALLLWLGAQVALVLAMWLYAKRGVVLLRESAAGPIGSGMLLGMLGFALAWAVQKPFGLAALWWARRHDVTEIGYLDWAIGGWAELTASFMSVCFALLVVMALARRLGSWWWLPGAAVFVVIAVGFAWVAPLLVRSDLDRPDDPELAATYERLARAEEVDGVPLRVETVSGTTSQANAYAFGIGGTRTIVIWDTMLDGRFSDREVAVVLAHELGHQAGGHLYKALVWFALFAWPGAWLLMRLTHRRGGMGTPEAVPLALFGLVCFTLVTTPLQNAISRRIEADADWRALTTTRDAEAARGLFVGFSKTSLGDPSPPTWAYLLLETHPTLAQRVAMVEAWKETVARK